MYQAITYPFAKFLHPGMNWPPSPSDCALFVFCSESTDQPCSCGYAPDTEVLVSSSTSSTLTPMLPVPQTATVVQTSNTDQALRM